MATLEIFKRTDGRFDWRLRSANGLLIATAGQGFDSKEGAKNGIAAVKSDAASAEIKDLTTKADSAGSRR
jgi:uncharacterized protein